MKKWIITDTYTGSERRGNGTHKLIWWLMVTFAGILIMGGMGWMTSINAQVNDMREELQDRGERLSKVEEALTGIRHDLSYIREKIDRLIGFNR